MKAIIEDQNNTLAILLTEALTHSQDVSHAACFVPHPTDTFIEVHFETEIFIYYENLFKANIFSRTRPRLLALSLLPWRTINKSGTACHREDDSKWVLVKTRKSYMGQKRF